MVDKNGIIITNKSKSKKWQIWETFIAFEWFLISEENNIFLFIMQKISFLDFLIISTDTVLCRIWFFIRSILIDLDWTSFQIISSMSVRQEWKTHDFSARKMIMPLKFNEFKRLLLDKPYFRLPTFFITKHQNLLRLNYLMHCHHTHFYDPHTRYINKTLETTYKPTGIQLCIRIINFKAEKLSIPSPLLS